MDWQIRTNMLLGSGVDRLGAAKVAVFGIGGVGSFAAEALARGGVGTLILVDNDCVAESNLNRQIVALHSTLGKKKAGIMAARIADINPDANVIPYELFYDASSAECIDVSDCDYIVDAIDTVTSKLLLIQRAQEAGIPIISSMGTGNKLDPCALKVADIYETSVCPLARVMRNELRKRGVKGLKVVYSTEQPLVPASIPESDSTHKKRQSPGSVSFVPSVAGLIIAGEVIKGIIGK
ncbi:MAG: tRNA threonylcarbamoyladenosine dehydratase [Clostridia bacterium]